MLIIFPKMHVSNLSQTELHLIQVIIVIIKDTAIRLQSTFTLHVLQ